MPQRHARGTFRVKIQPLPTSSAKGLMNMSIDKEIHGDLEATSKGEMITSGNPKAGEAGYVAMEMVTGKIGEKSGSFALQHSATMNAGTQELKIIVTPGSGVGDFKDITGTFTLTVANGVHSYDLEYTLP